MSPRTPNQEQCKKNIVRDGGFLLVYYNLRHSNLCCLLVVYIRISAFLLKGGGDWVKRVLTWEG